MDIVPQKRCTHCKVIKPTNQFYRNARKKDGLSSDCRDCLLAYSRSENAKAARQKRDKELPAQRKSDRTRRGHWGQRYGISTDEYWRMNADQCGLCAICGTQETGRSNNGGVRLLAVDHCHKTGKIRGLLCGKCNRIIGELGDDMSLFRRFVTYLSE